MPTQPPIIPGFDFKKMPGDGHCFYNAVCQHIEGSSQERLRQLVATHIRNNFNRFSHTITYFMKEDEYLDVIKYIDAIEKETIWADQIVIQALMEILDRPILIYGPYGELRYELDVLNHFNGSPIPVYYNGYNHYDALLYRDRDLSENQMRKLFQPDFKKRKHFDEIASYLKAHIDNKNIKSIIEWIRENRKENDRKKYLSGLRELFHQLFKGDDSNDKVLKTIFRIIFDIPDGFDTHNASNFLEINFNLFAEDAEDEKENQREEKKRIDFLQIRNGLNKVLNPKNNHDEIYKSFIRSGKDTLFYKFCEFKIKQIKKIKKT